MATVRKARAQPLREGAYLTNGRRLLRVVEVHPDGSVAVEDARTERLRVLGPEKLASWEAVTPRG